MASDSSVRRNQRTRDLRLIDQACDRLEQDWKMQSEPDLAEYLQAIPEDLKAIAFAELLALDIPYRFGSPTKKNRDYYLKRFAEFREIVEREFRLGGDFPQEGSFFAQSATDVTTQGIGNETLLDLPGFRVIRRLSQGGMGVVYLAEELDLRRLVAVKTLLNSDFADREERSRFQLEAEAAAALDHSNIAKVYRVGQYQSRPYLVMEYISGGNLREVMDSGPLPPRLSAEIAAAIADGLQHAHEQGIIHRDLKPSNVLIEPRGGMVRSQQAGTDSRSRKVPVEKETSNASTNRASSKKKLRSPYEGFSLSDMGCPKLADFGLARRLTVPASMPTRSGTILGTPHYLSPEQARGQSNAVDARSDVYSLGVLLYEMLTARVPFEGEIASVLQKVVHEEPPSVRRVVPSVPVDLETICAKAMAKEPYRRYASAVAMAKDLRAFLEYRPIQAKRTRALTRFVLWCKRKPALALTLALCFCIVSATIATSYFRVLDERNRYRFERDRAESHLYRSLLSDATSQKNARGTGWYWRAMDNLEQAARLDVDVRDQQQLLDLALECEGTRYPCLQLTCKWTGHPSAVIATACSTDGKLLATASANSVAVWATDEMLSPRLKPARRFEFTLAEDTFTAVGFLPQSSLLIASTTQGNLIAIDLALIKPDGMDSFSLDTPENDQLRFVRWKLDHGTIYNFDVSPDGMQICFACGDGSIGFGKTEPLKNAVARGLDQSAVRIKFMPGHENPATCLSFSYDGKMLVTGGLGGVVRIWGVSSCKIIDTWLLGTRCVDLCFANLRNGVAHCTELDFGIGFREVGTEKFFGKANLHSGSINRLLFDSEDYVYSISGDGLVKIWNLLLAGTGDLELLAIADADLPSATSATLSNNEKILAVGHSDGQIALWEIRKSRLVNLSSQSAVFLGQSNRIANGSGIWDGDKHWRDTLKLLRAKSFHAIASLPDQNKLVAGNDAGEIQCLHANGKKINSWQAHHGQVAALAVRKNSNPVDAGRSEALLASAGVDGLLKLWDWETGALVKESDPKLGAIHALAWDPIDQNRIAISGEGGVGIWTVDSEEMQRVSEVAHWRSTLDWSTTAFVHCGAENQVEVYDAATLVHEQSLTVSDSAVTGMAFSIDGSTLAVSSQRGEVSLWETNNWQPHWKSSTPQSGGSQIIFEHTGDYLLTTPSNEQAILWDARKGVALAKLGRFRYAATVSPNGDGFVTCGAAGEIGEFTRDRLKEGRAGSRNGSGDLVELHPDRTWSEDAGSSDPTWCVVSDPRGQLLATGTHQGRVKLWDANRVELLSIMHGHSNPVWCLAFSESISQKPALLSGSLSAEGDEGEIILWDLEQEARRHTFRGHRSLVRSIAVHPTQRLAVSSATDGSVILWDLEERKMLGLLHQFDKMAAQLAFDPEGKYLAAALHDCRIAVWKFEDLLRRREKENENWLPTEPDLFLTDHTHPVWAVNWNHDGKYFASGSDKGTIILRDGATFESIATLRAETGQIRSIAFNHDASLMAGSAYASPLVVWDLDRLNQLRQSLSIARSAEQFDK